MATFVCSRCYRITVGYICRCPYQTIERREVVQGDRVLIRPAPSKWEGFKRWVRKLLGLKQIPKQRNGIYSVSVDTWGDDDDKHSS